MNKEHIFLTPDQVLDAMCRDLRQYEPQIMLLCEIAQTICGDHATIKRDPGSNRVWVRHAHKTGMQELDGADMTEFVCDLIKSAKMDSKLLLSISGRVFQSRARTGTDPETGKPAICIETGMESYNCRQCGRCCRDLDYRNQLTARDVQRWRTAGRHDILKWVGITRRADGREAYSMWVIPGTTRISETCPFLEPGRQQHGTDAVWSCRIHDVKPDICRQYPINRKHATMTGCLGFENQINGKAKHIKKMT